LIQIGKLDHSPLVGIFYRISRSGCNVLPIPVNEVLRHAHIHTNHKKQKTLTAGVKNAAANAA
jgi:hypothetical protein